MKFPKGATNPQVSSSNLNKSIYKMTKINKKKQGSTEAEPFQISFYFCTFCEKKRSSVSKLWTSFRCWLSEESVKATCIYQRIPSKIHLLGFISSIAFFMFFFSSAIKCQQLKTEGNVNARRETASWASKFASFVIGHDLIKQKRPNAERILRNQSVETTS